MVEREVLLCGSLWIDPREHLLNDLVFEKWPTLYFRLFAFHFFFVKFFEN